MSEQKIPVIKFSHRYKKLSIDQNKCCAIARLLDVININLENLSEEFRNYDTDDGLYPLPKKGKYMILIFLKPHSLGIEERNLFTTIRRWLPAKEKYYRSHIGQAFLTYLS